MSLRRLLLILLVLVASLSIAGSYLLFRSGLYQPADDEPLPALLIRDAMLFDGSTLRAGMQVLVEGGVITCVDSVCAVPPGARVIDGTGKTLLPGLIDLGAQYYSQSAESRDASPLRQLLAFTKQRPDVRRNLHRAGITTLRTAGDAPGNILLLRKQLAEGDLEGPQLHAAGPYLTAPGGHPLATTYAAFPDIASQLVRTVGDSASARALAREWATAGFDGLYLVLDDRMRNLPKPAPAAVRELVAAAHRDRLRVFVWAGSAADVALAATAEADGILYGGAALPDTATLRLMQELGICLVPCLAARQVQSDSLLSADTALLPLLYAAGVPVGAAGMVQGDRAFGAALHEELEALVAAGLPPLAALAGCTRQAARALAIDHLCGQVAPGYQADLLLVDGRPWEQIADLRRVHTLIQRGRIVVETGSLTGD
ncbi:MAG: amidohydrolase family protein [Bacteroidia bacterium]